MINIQCRKCNQINELNEISLSLGSWFCNICGCLNIIKEDTNAENINK